jgi:hypothetical protein
MTQATSAIVKIPTESPQAAPSRAAKSSGRAKKTASSSPWTLLPAATSA